MKTLVFLTLCSVLTLGPVASRFLPGLCELQRLHDELFCNGSLIGSYCPQCDAQGNFLPQQCWASTGYCWCVDVVSGKEIPGTSTPPTAPRVDCDELERWSCPDGWSNFQQTCFTFINTPKKWIEAEVYCQFDGGSLASIHSKEENHFIMSLTRGFTNNFPQTWLGGFDAIHPGFWMWSDGSDFNYENWYNNPRGEEGGDEGDEGEGGDEGDEGEGGDEGDEGDDGDDDDEGDEGDGGDGGHKGGGGHHGDHGDGGDHGNKGGDGDDGDEGDDSDEGDDHPDKPQSNDDCLKMNYDYDLKWFHGSCTKRLPFVCAKQAHRAPH